MERSTRVEQIDITQTITTSTIIICVKCNENIQDQMTDPIPITLTLYIMLLT